MWPDGRRQRKARSRVDAADRTVEPQARLKTCCFRHLITFSSNDDLNPCRRLPAGTQPGRPADGKLRCESEDRRTQSVSVLGRAVLARNADGALVAPAVAKWPANQFHTDPPGLHDHFCDADQFA